jgi:hypothetical protein
MQNPQAAPPEGLRLDDLANLSWPVAARGERLGGGPVQHARLTEVESLPGPSAANFATPHLVVADTHCSISPRKVIRPSNCSGFNFLQLPIRLVEFDV